LSTNPSPSSSSPFKHSEAGGEGGEIGGEVGEVGEIGEIGEIGGEAGEVGEVGGEAGPSLSSKRFSQFGSGLFPSAPTTGTKSIKPSLSLSIKSEHSDSGLRLLVGDASARRSPETNRRVPSKNVTVATPLIFDFFLLNAINIIITIFEASS
jgi:hypothetical protein